MTRGEGGNVQCRLRSLAPLHTQASAAHLSYELQYCLPTCCYSLLGGDRQTCFLPRFIDNTGRRRVHKM